MKKILFFAASLAGLLFAASCQQEMLEPVSVSNTVTFTVEAPGAMNTKSTINTGATIADGTNVNEVHYAVYKTHSGEDYSIDNSGEIDGPLAQGVVPMNNKRATINFDLLQDQNFTVIFWAQVEGAGHYELGDLRTIKMATSVAGNDESRAAFFARYDFDTYEHKDHTVTLKRPFAQLNLLTTAESLTPVQTGQTTGYTIDVKTSEVVVNGLSAEFNTLTGVAPAADETFVFEMAESPEEQGQETLTVNGKAYHYVSMNYFFVPEEEKLVDIKYSVVTDKGSIKNEIVAVPVKENHRTNVIGNLLTKESTFTIIVDERFDGQELVQVWDGREVSKPVINKDGVYEISFASELAWLAAAVNGTLPVTEDNQLQTEPVKEITGATFKLVEDIDLENALWTPIGATGEFKGTFDGNGKTIRNLNVNVSGTTRAGLFANCIGYIQNLTVENANIVGQGMSGVIIGNAQCTRIDNCHVRKAVVTTTPYEKNNGGHAGAIAGYVSADGTAWVKNCSVSEATITAYRDVAALVGTATRSNNNSAVISDNKVDNVTVIADQTAEYAEVKDCNAGAIVGRNIAATLDGNEYENVTIIRKVDSTEELAYAVAEAQSGETIYIGGEVVMPYFTGKALNFEGINANAVVKQSPATHLDKFYEGSELNFKKVTLVGTSYTTSTQGYQKALKETYTECNFQDYIMFAGAETIVNKCNFTSTVGQYFWTATAVDITFNECSFDVLERAIKVCTVGNTGVERTATFNKCQFVSKNAVKAAIEIDGTKGSSYIVYINNCTEEGFAEGEESGETMFNVEGAENVIVYVDGRKWVSSGIQVAEDGTKYYTNTTGLNAALAEAQEGDVINLLPGEFNITSYKPGIMLIGTSAEDVKVNMENQKPGLNGGNVYIENVTLQFANKNYCGFQHTGDEYYKNCVIEGQPFLYGNNVKFENCTFNQTSSDWYNVWTYGAKNVVFEECTFNSAGKSVLVYCETSSLEQNVTLNDCTLNASGAVEGKAAVEIDASLITKAIVNLNNTTATGFAEGSVSRNTLWNIKKGATKAEVYVNEVFCGGYKVEDGVYTVSTADALQAAIAAAQDGDVINLANGGYFEGLFFVEKGLTIEAVDEATINGKLAIAASGKTVNVKGVTFENSYTGPVTTGHQYVDKTGNYCIGLYCASVNVEGCTFNLSKDGGINFYAFNAPERCTVTGCTFNANGYRPILSKANLTVDGCTFNDQYKYSLQVWGNQNTGNETVVFKNNKVYNPGKTSRCADGYKSFVSISKSYPISNVAFTMTGNTGDCNFVYDDNANVNITSCTLNGKAIVEGQIAAIAGITDVKEVLAEPAWTVENGEYNIYSATGLFWFANEVNVNKNAFAGKTVKLAADIDLANAAWTPVGQTGATTFNGVFDGQNYTISNLNVDSKAQTGEYYSSGLFGWVETHTAGCGVIKNVKINGATVTGHHNCGALVGYITENNALVENCHVTGAVITCTYANGEADGDKAGALIGNATVATTVKDCTAAKSTVSAGRDAGQVIGAGKAANVTGCSATDVTVAANGTGTGANVRNEVIGRLL